MPSRTAPSSISVPAANSSGSSIAKQRAVADAIRSAGRHRGRQRHLRRDQDQRVSAESGKGRRLRLARRIEPTRRGHRDRHSQRRGRSLRRVEAGKRHCLRSERSHLARQRRQRGRNQVPCADAVSPTAAERQTSASPPDARGGDCPIPWWIGALGPESLDLGRPIVETAGRRRHCPGLPVVAAFDGSGQAVRKR